MKHILVTTDFSEASESAFGYAKEQFKLAGKENNKITLLKVIDVVPPASINFEYGLALPDKKRDAGKSIQTCFRANAEDSRKTIC